MEEKVLKAVKRFNIEERVILSTFNHESLALCARLAPHIERAALTSDVLYQADRYITSIPASGYHPKLNSPATADKVLKKMRNSSIKVRPYTLNRPEDMKRLFEAGADGIFTDFPAKALALLKINSCFRRRLLARPSFSFIHACFKAYIHRRQLEIVSAVYLLNEVKP